MSRTVYAVDELGGTFVFETREDAETFLVSEAWGQATNLTIFSFEEPRGGMTWDELADYAVSVAPDVSEDES